MTDLLERLHWDWRDSAFWWFENRQCQEPQRSHWRPLQGCDDHIEVQISTLWGWNAQLQALRKWIFLMFVTFVVGCWLGVIWWKCMRSGWNNVIFEGIVQAQRIVASMVISNRCSHSWCATHGARGVLGFTGLRKGQTRGIRQHMAPTGAWQSVDLCSCTACFPQDNLTTHDVSCLLVSLEANWIR